MSLLVTVLAVFFGCIAFYRGVFRREVESGNRLPTILLLVGMLCTLGAAYPLIVKAPFAVLTLSGFALGIAGLVAMMFRRREGLPENTVSPIVALGTWAVAVAAGIFIPRFFPAAQRADRFPEGVLFIAIFAGFCVIQLVRAAVYGARSKAISMLTFGVLAVCGVVLASQSFGAAQRLPVEAGVALLVLTISGLGIAQASGRLTAL